MWFRRDLRLRDNPALAAAAAHDGRVVPLFVLDDRLWGPSGAVRRAYLGDSLRALDTALGGALVVRHGDPAHVLPEVVAAADADAVHISEDFGPYGRARDLAVEAALAVPLVRTGSPYAVSPGRVRKDDGTAYRVYTPFYRAWLRHGWRAPADPAPGDTEWLHPLAGDPIPAPSAPVPLPTAGEDAAWAAWEAFRTDGVASYADLRDRPDLRGTSRLGHHLKWGEIHPRSLLAELGESDGEEVFRKEIAWREFYADVLNGTPASARASLDARFDERMEWASGTDAEQQFTAWCEGRTGFPFVDAGMRQLRNEGWMHNRVRMVVASFLVKDLHLPWQRGAAHFMTWLRDGDLASNSHGWQWAAGCGTDASPYHRIFNPVGQGERFDPDGDYVRAYIPELRHLVGKTAHQPWSVLGGYDGGYPERIVDHAAERLDALERFAAVKR
jgi:deoxyribodipyrimidine photo-lyase